MREELKTYDWHVCNLSKSDIEYIVRTVDQIIKDRKTLLDDEISQIYKDDPESADDIWDDLSYYKNLECFYLWEFLIIRIIGIFEGIIERHFLPQAKYRGYNHRIKALKENNYALKNEGEISEWVNLRNALAHSPTEQYRPIFIDKSDIDDLCKTLFDSIDDLYSQRSAGKSV